MHPKTAASYPALPLQQGMIFNGLRLPDAGIDVVQCVIRWPGLDVAAYRAAWERAVARHPILRTGFHLAGDAEPVQVVRPEAVLDFTVRGDGLTDFLAADRLRGFSFEEPPLVRVTILMRESTPNDNGTSDARVATRDPQRHERGDVWGGGEPRGAVEGKRGEGVENQTRHAAEEQGRHAGEEQSRRTSWDGAEKTDEGQPRSADGDEGRSESGTGKPDTSRTRSLDGNESRGGDESRGGVEKADQGQPRSVDDDKGGSRAGSPGTSRTRSLDRHEGRHGTQRTSTSLTRNPLRGEGWRGAQRASTSPARSLDGNDDWHGTQKGGTSWGRSLDGDEDQDRAQKTSTNLVRSPLGSDGRLGTEKTSTSPTRNLDGNEGWHGTQKSSTSQARSLDRDEGWDRTQRTSTNWAQSLDGNEGWREAQKSGASGAQSLDGDGDWDRAQETSTAQARSLLGSDGWHGTLKTSTSPTRSLDGNEGWRGAQKSGMSWGQSLDGDWREAQKGNTSLAQGLDSSEGWDRAQKTDAGWARSADGDGDGDGGAQKASTSQMRSGDSDAGCGGAEAASTSQAWSADGDRDRDDVGVPLVVVSLHHAVLDGRSLAMLLSEVDSDYEGRADFPQRSDYRDFVEWYVARNSPAGAAIQQDLSFWAEHLAGVSGATSLPFGKALTDGATIPVGRGGDVVRFSLSDLETAALRRIADSQGVTLNTIVLAAWALVLSVHSGTDDVVLGVTRSVRHGSVSGADGIIGMLLATIPLRLRVDRTLSVRDWLRVVRQVGVDVRGHQLAPLAEIQRAAGVANLLSSLVLFERQDLETLLRRQNPAWLERSVELHRRLSYPLTVYAFAEPALHVVLIHDRYSPAEADALAGHLRAALLQLAHRPDVLVGQLDLVPSAELAWLTSGGHANDWPRQRTIPELFDQQVRLSPDAHAVLDGDLWVTYAQLAEWATRIAGALRVRGVRTEEAVAVALPRGAALVASLLGVLKAGAAYLPIDPSHPAARNATMLADSGARVIIAGGGDWGVDVLDVEDLPAAPAFPCPATADTLAYLNYTSGSTGRPKGVAVPHRGVARLVHQPNFATVGPGQTFLHASSTSFDVTTFELWGALLTGGRVVPAPPGPLDPPELARLIKQHDVSVLWLTAGLFHQLVEYDVTTLSEVDQVLAGGDVLAPSAVAAALAARDGKPVINGYGPTENTTFTSCHVMHGPQDLGATTPIGRPVQHTTVYVLDDDLRPVPVGAVGELYSGGDGVARGYLNRAGLTAGKFLPDPFGAPGSRMYRTGDRARWRADGTLEFLGRVDNQVKVRGFLVEPGETESVLRTHPQVGDAAVVVRGDDDTRRLVAYLAPSAGELDLASVRAHVASALPEYLRPATYQVLPLLPLNASGKVDRAALPEPENTVDSVRVPLTTDVQRRLADLWRAMLRVDDIGAGDGFFDLGGNSLLAMRLTFRIRDTFGVEVPIREIYRATTLADLAEFVATVEKPATNGIVRRDRTAYRAAPDHLVAPTATENPDRNWALWRWVELRGTGFDIASVLGLASSACAAAAADVVSREQEFRCHRGAVLDGIKDELTVAPPEAKPALRKGSRLICKGRLAELADDITRRPHASELLDAAAALDTARSTYATAFAVATGEVADALRAVARDPKFREAVAWQNPRALHTAVDSLAATEVPRHNSQYRQWVSLVTNYLQRYTTKNDTIGFFGPVGWARVSGATPMIDVRPGAGLLADRTVFLENWAVHELALALSTPDALPWAVPRRMPFVGIDGDTLHVPLQAPVELPAEDAAVLRAVHGVRTAREIAADFPELDVLAVLARLRDERRIAWTFEVSPALLVPQRALREQLSAIGDPAVREPAVAALDQLEAGRQAVADAVGDPDRLASAISALQDVFTRHTGSAAVRRPGKFYAGRTLVYEECRRDLDVEVGPELVATLMPPLSLMLESARWFTSAGAALFRRALRDTFRARVAATGEAAMRLADFWLWANDIIFRLDKRVIGRLTAALQDRWANILLLDLTQKEVRLGADALRDKVGAAFAAPRPGWRSAVQHSPDVMIAARDVDAIRAGDFQWVLGELHAGVNTMRSALFVSQHPNAAELHTAMSRDLAGPRIVLAATREEGGTPQRLADALVQPGDIRVVSAHDACGPDLVGSTLVADLLVSEQDGRLVAHDRDGGNRMDLVELVNEQLMGQLVQHFRPLPQAPHTPRVSIDKLVISRENWRLPTRDLAFAFGADEPARFLRAQEWRHVTGVPRFLFVKSPVELKPFYVDLDSLPSVEHFAHAIRALDREEPGGVMSIGEMLPGPDEVWLTDAAGARYTAEFRFVAVDRRGPASEGQS